MTDLCSILPRFMLYHLNINTPQLIFHFENVNYYTQQILLGLAMNLFIAINLEMVAVFTKL